MGCVFVYINDIETFSAFKLQGIRKFIPHTIAITFTFQGSDFGNRFFFFGFYLFLFSKGGVGLG